MSVVVVEPESQRAWREGEAATIAAVSAMNRAVASLVDTVGMLLETDGWTGWGIRTPEHWLQWKANVSQRRAEGLVHIARRRADLPTCWALFEEGRLTEDAMVRIARRTPACRDAEVAAVATGLTVSQLGRVLAALPEHPDDDTDEPPGPDPQRYLRTFRRADGWLRGEFQLPPDEGASLQAGLDAAREAVFREAQDLPDDAEVSARAAGTVTWADALARLASAGLDALDGHLQRTGRPGDRHQVIIHRHLLPAGHLSPARLHGSAVALPDRLARYLTCDTEVAVALRQGGRLLGFSPTERSPNRRLRRWLEHRDGGCVHPLCNQTRWLHAHHLQHWEDGGPTVGSNLVCLCPSHHRSLHHGDFTIEGDPEAGSLRFADRWGRPIEPPELSTGPPAEPEPPPSYQPPFGERLTEWTWN